MVGRYTGVNIGTEYDVDYGFDQYGRFNSVTNGTDTFTYGYLTNSNLVSTLTVGDISVNNTYETNRNLITSVENKYDTTTVSKYDYVDDAIGRRTSMAKSGTAFTQSDTISYGYNDRSEVTSATAANDSNYNFGFAFDNIGNRSTSTIAGTETTYTSNNLNQYTQIGTQTPTYDADGNMLTVSLSTGDWTYTWNAENRLIKAEKSDQKLEFSYDYMGRRVEKKVTDKVGTIWTQSKYLKFVYNGYKLIEVLDGANSDAVLQKIVWSGETPISIYDASLDATYYYVLDANKNVSDLIDASGNVVAHYEYSPFGKIVRQTGSYAGTNPIRFSSEYFDSETELVYYNYRYYSPELGRWTKRDDIGIRGGWNLYFMTWNDAINLIDNLGHELVDGMGRYHRDNGQYGTNLEKFKYEVKNTPVAPSPPASESWRDWAMRKAKAKVLSKITGLMTKLALNIISLIGSNVTADIVHETYGPTEEECAKKKGVLVTEMRKVVRELVQYSVKLTAHSLIPVPPQSKSSPWIITTKRYMNYRKCFSCCDRVVLLGKESSMPKLSDGTESTIVQAISYSSPLVDISGSVEKEKRTISQWTKFNYKCAD
jgi:RHS repeat-associated protein